MQTPVPGQASLGTHAAQLPPIAAPADADQGTMSDEQSESLDEEWVNKARDIVERTKDDPFTQVNELSKVKAGYLKARYNKEYKAGEDSA